MNKKIVSLVTFESKTFYMVVDFLPSYWIVTLVFDGSQQVRHRLPTTHRDSHKNQNKKSFNFYGVSQGTLKRRRDSVKPRVKPFVSLFHKKI